MNTDVNALEVLPAQTSDDEEARLVTGCDLATYCFSHSCTAG